MELTFGLKWRSEMESFHGLLYTLGNIMFVCVIVIFISHS